MNEPEQETESGALLSIGDIATRLQLRRRKVRAIIRLGQMPAAFKIGKYWRIEKAELELWIKRQQLRNNSGEGQ